MTERCLGIGCWIFAWPLWCIGAAVLAACKLVGML